MEAANWPFIHIHMSCTEWYVGVGDFKAPFLFPFPIEIESKSKTLTQPNTIYP